LARWASPVGGLRYIPGFEDRPPVRNRHFNSAIPIAGTLWGVIGALLALGTGGGVAARGQIV